MIITIDGYSGSGKSTQAKKISEALEIPVANAASVVSSVRILRMEGLTLHRARIANLFDALCMYRLVIAKYKRNVIVEECLFYPFFHFDKSSKHQASLSDETINWFIESMVIDSRQYPDGHPIASFYLFTSQRTSEIRRFKRAYKGYEINIDCAEGDYHKDPRFRFWKKLECKIPFLHVIDGMQTEAEVTADIMAILEKEKDLK